MMKTMNGKLLSLEISTEVGFDIKHFGAAIRRNCRAWLIERKIETADFDFGAIRHRRGRKKRSIEEDLES